MTDLLCIAMTFALFGISLLYTVGCDRLKGKRK
jgi:hypothetical protein